MAFEEVELTIVACLWVKVALGAAGFEGGAYLLGLGTTFSPGCDVVSSSFDEDLCTSLSPEFDFDTPKVKEG